MCKLLLKIKLVLIPLLVFLNQAGYAQCTLNCPDNITVTATLGQCGAIVKYTLPTIPESCGAVQADSKSFAYTGSEQTFTVPQGVTSIRIKAWGAQGGGSPICGENGGLGGYAEGILAVTPGSTLYIYAGGKPANTTFSSGGGAHPGGFNGGGSHVARAGGSGASDVRLGDSSLDSRVIVAGGGGIRDSLRYCPAGGSGGGSSGTGGGYLPFNGLRGSGGGTQSSGGAAGTNGKAGTWGQGGNAISTDIAGGGGGYYGGGSSMYGAGGGGSGYTGGVTDNATQTGVNVGNSKVEFLYTVTATPTLTQTAGSPSGSMFEVGTTTNTFELNDGNGNITSCSFTVTVRDEEKPVLTGPKVPVQCYNSSGSYTIPALTAADNCGIQSIGYIVSGATVRTGSGQDASGAFKPGVSTITWTVTDAHGNKNISQATVTVKPSITVTIPDAKVLSKGVEQNAVYLGYSPATALTLTAQASGDSRLTYQWNTGATTPSIKVSPTTTTTYSVVVSDGTCTGSAAKSIKVVDVRCGTKKDKVSVCHGGNTLCIDKTSVADHLNHGDYLGGCRRASAAYAGADQETAVMPPAGALTAAPNPFAAQKTTLTFTFNQDEAYTLTVYDVSGRLVQQLPAGKAQAGERVQVAWSTAQVPAGVYLVKLTSNRGVQYLRLVRE